MNKHNKIAYVVGKQLLKTDIFPHIFVLNSEQNNF